MYMLAKSSESIIQIFTSLCLSQVKEQLTENLLFTVLNPESFICNGHLFTVIDNNEVILDESLPEYELDRCLANRFN